MTTRVINRSSLTEPIRWSKRPELVDIGRAGPWGNPFVIGRDGTREEVVAKHREWLPTQIHLMNRLRELQGKTLVCFCKPLVCHGDTLVEFADAENLYPW